MVFVIFLRSVHRYACKKKAHFGLAQCIAFIYINYAFFFASQASKLNFSIQTLSFCLDTK